MPVKTSQKATQKLRDGRDQAHSSFRRLKLERSRSLSMPTAQDKNDKKQEEEEITNPGIVQNDKYDCTSGVCILSQKELKKRQERIRKQWVSNDSTEPFHVVMVANNETKRKSTRKAKPQPRTVSINPKLWGPFAWRFLEGLVVHFSSFLTHNQDLVVELFVLFSNLVPCDLCQTEFKLMLNQTRPLTAYWTISPQRLSMWLNLAHNAVNRRNGSPSWSYVQHQKAVSKVTLQQWLEAMFATLYYLMEYQSLKCSILLRFLELLQIMLQSHPKLKFIANQFASVLNHPHSQSTKCTPSCLQEKIFCIRNQSSYIMSA